MKDLPDYTKQVTVRHEGAFTGLEELAIRLGSIAPWDLYGHAILQEGFETEETEWTLTPHGTGSAASRQTRHKYSGDWALKLTAGAEDGAYARATRQIHHPGELKLAMFGRLGWDVNLQMWLFGASAEKDGVEKFARIRYTLPTTTLEVYEGAGAWTELSTSLEIDSVGYVFHPVLITFDLSTGYYDKLYIDDEEIDLGAYELPELIASPGPYLQADVHAYAVGSDGCTIYTDDIIIAKNVP
jgi:hypothetical protein